MQKSEILWQHVRKKMKNKGKEKGRPKQRNKGG